jgi:hypothetical protein
MAARPERVDGLDALALEDDRLRVVLVPEVGAKIVSLQHRPTGREWLWRNPRRRLERPRYGSDFAGWDISGYDDCFPTIGECSYPEEPWRGAIVPDHGELWTLPWRARVEADELLLSAHGVRFPYNLTKRLSLGADGLRMSYLLENPTPFAFKWMFSAHPLFALTPSTEVELPDRAALRLDSSIGRVLGQRGDRHAWPLTRDVEGREIDLRRLDPAAGRGDKLYAGPLPEGRARLVDRATGEWVGFAWDADELPLCGLWLNQGGWPPDGEPCFNAALEPCNGFPDPLDQAIGRGEHGTVEPFGTARWTLRLNAGQ